MGKINTLEDIMQFGLVLLLCLGVATADKWPNFRTTFGLNLFGNIFEPQPLTRGQAIAYGYSPVSADNTCAGAFLGFAYADPAEPSVVMLYDDNGYIAGTQSVILKSALDPAASFKPDTIPAYVAGTFFDQEAYFTTAYFVDPAVICAGGRTDEQVEEQGTGDRLWIQVGDTPDNFVKIPLVQSEADETANWYKHLCFVGMGTHYMEFNYEIDQDCNAILPVQILYDQGVITGFVWQHVVYLPGERWEHPDTNAVNMIIDKPPQCALDLAGQSSLTTLHHYFYDHPWFTQCIF